MEEVTISPKALEDAMRKALNLSGTASNARVEFYDKFQRAADDHDSDFIKKYDEDMNTTLIFAGLFSAVAGAFIIDVQSKLEPDYQEMNHALLKIVASAALGNIPTGPDAAFPQWNGPDPTIVHVQSILYSSLAASLLAAFIAMLGKQWLNRYAQVEKRGSVIGRSRYRQRKMDGMISWHFDLVMECLPLMLQAALFMLGYALSNYLYFINRTVASVIGFTAFGLLFYVLIVSAATLSYNCPFQTPPSLILRFLVRFDSEHREYLKRFRKWLGCLFSHKKQPRQEPVGPHHLPTPGMPGDNHSVGHIELHLPTEPNQPLRLFTNDNDLRGFVLDSNCIAQMFLMSTDPDFITAIMKFIPEVVWHAGVHKIPLERLYDTLVGCFDCSSGCHIMIPRLEDKAYISAKALLHLAIQCKSIGGGCDKLFESISRRHLAMEHKSQKGNSDLESTLGIINNVFGGSEVMHWKDFSFTIPHHTWMGHILVYYAWDFLKKGEPLPHEIKEFISYSFQSEPPAPIMADCFFLIGFLLGINLHESDLSAVDKSSQLSDQVDKVYEKLVQILEDPKPNDINCALEVLDLISDLSLPPIPNHHKLFLLVMQCPVTEAQSQTKWKASHLAMQGAYKGGGFKDAQNILIFLNHHLELAVGHGQSWDEPIQNALCALADTPDDVILEALKQFDPTTPSFVHSISYLFEGNRPLALREAALLFFSRICDRWFSTYSPIMDSTRMSNFVRGWAFTIEHLRPTHTTQKAALIIFLGMINSPHWYPYITPEKWILLEHYMLVPGNLWSVHRCINNPGLMDEARKVENPRAMVLWVETLWFNYAELVPRMKEKLRMVTEEIAQNERDIHLNASQSHIGRYLSHVNSELRKAEEALDKHTGGPDDLEAVPLEKKIRMLREAVRHLDTIRQGRTS